MDVFKAILSRHSCRNFDGRTVEPEKIDKILEAARWAPSPANSQPWEFIVVTDKSAINRLYEHSKEAKKSGVIELRGFSYIRPLPEKVKVEEKPATRYSLKFLKDVPVVIGVVGIPAPTIKQGIVERTQDSYKYACAAAIQNMLLAAEDQGLGSLWFTMYDPALVSGSLRVDPSKHLLALVCIGYPAGKPSPRDRIALRQKVRWIK